jgi:glycosyltransferase involved in cell wall biosynthesis
MRTGKPLPWLFRRSLRRVRHIVANSHGARDTLARQYGVDVARITVIHNSLVFPPESAMARNRALRNQHGADAATTVLLCVAMFRPEKHQRELIEIAAGLPGNLNWQLWLAGDGPERGRCEQLAAAKGLQARVKFLGFQRNPTPTYCAADLAVHASSSESLSNFLIEAQAHGLPGVVYEAQGIAECFRVGHTGWVIPRGDHREFLAELVRQIAEPPAAREARAAEAKRHARQLFDPARQFAAYLTLFQELLAAPRHDQQAAHRPHRSPHPRAKVRRPADARRTLRRIAFHGAPRPRSTRGPRHRPPPPRRRLAH